eukprot:gb/GECG01002177.1/.p1 GENE.gb/GECG01002177.1/~~gb/GECG01002177.1/.p1  ORF type:complete len:179 (+),score=15.87 gb/GECG01002177.1/:1-537(+)
MMLSQSTLHAALAARLFKLVEVYSYSWRRNCNHFSEAFVQRLAGVSIPPYVNRLAYVGSAVSCLIPADQRRGGQSNDNQDGGGDTSGFTVIAPPSRAARSTGTSGSSAVISTGSGTAGSVSSGGAGTSSWLSSMVPGATENQTGQGSQSESSEPASERRAKMLQAAVQRRQQQEQPES